MAGIDKATYSRLATILDETYASRVVPGNISENIKKVKFNQAVGTAGVKTLDFYYDDATLLGPTGMSAKSEKTIRQTLDHYGNLFHMDPAVICGIMYYEAMGMVVGFKTPEKGSAWITKAAFNMARLRNDRYQDIFTNRARCVSMPQIQASQTDTSKRTGKATLDSSNNAATIYDTLFQPFNTMLKEVTPELRAEGNAVSARVIHAYNKIKESMTVKKQMKPGVKLISSGYVDKAKLTYKVEVSITGDGKPYTGKIKMIPSIITNQAKLIADGSIKIQYKGGDNNGQPDIVNRDRWINNGKLEIFINRKTTAVPIKYNGVLITIYSNSTNTLDYTLTDASVKSFIGSKYMADNTGNNASAISSLIGDIVSASAVDVSYDQPSNSYNISINLYDFLFRYYGYANETRTDVAQHCIALAMVLNMDIDACIFICASVLRWKIPSNKVSYRAATNSYYDKESLVNAIGDYLGSSGKDAYGTDKETYITNVSKKYISTYTAKRTGADLYYNTEFSAANCKYIHDTATPIAGTVLKFADQSDDPTPDPNQYKISTDTFDTWLAKQAARLNPELGSFEGVTNDKEIIEQIKNYYATLANVKAVNLAGVIGLPPRFPDTVDPRLDDYNATDKNIDIYGPIYTKLYLEAGHIVTLTPGEPEFLQGFSEADKVNMATLIAYQNSGATEGDKSLANTIIATETAKQDAQNQTNEATSSGKGRAGGTLFGFKLEYVKYTNIVTALNYATAVMFGITDYEWYSILDDNERAAIFKGKVPKEGSTALSRDYFDPSKFDRNTNMIYGLADAGATSSKNNESIGQEVYNTYIYNNGPLTMNESVANNVGPSQLNQLLGMTPNESLKDMTFLMNTPVGNNVQFLEKIKSTGFFKNILSDNSILGKVGTKMFGLGTQIASIAGANIKLPDVFKDSSYNKSFEIKIKLTSPNNDRLSFFKYIMTDFNRIMPYVLPKQYGAFVDAQLAPFLVQVYSRGLVACELGMVTNMDIVRNAETLSLNRYPTEIDLVLTIKDLSPVLGIPMDSTDINARMNRNFISSGIIPYLSTYAGIPLYRSDNMDFWTRKFYKLSNIGHNLVSTPEKAAQQFISEGIRDIARRIVK